eukprot:696612-Prymnesium_polylepis.1
MGGRLNGYCGSSKSANTRDMHTAESAAWTVLLQRCRRWTSPAYSTQRHRSATSRPSFRTLKLVRRSRRSSPTLRRAHFLQRQQRLQW